MGFGKEIKRLREQVKPKKISAQKLADILGVSADKLRQWEQRDADPVDYADIEKIEKKLGISIQDISSLQYLPKFVKPQASTFSRANADEIVIEALIEIIASLRALLLVASELQSLALNGSRLPTELAGIYQRMVKDLALQVGEELEMKVRAKS